ncbi:unnamed protein product, partial [Brenthis ino]
MFFWPIPATAANLIETNQLRRRFCSAQVYAQTQRALSIPVTLIFRWDDCSTRPESGDNPKNKNWKCHQLFQLDRNCKVAACHNE